MRDWCANSLYLAPGVRQEVNETVDSLVADAAGGVVLHLAGVRALLVGGSLARREPSVRAAPPHALVSDIDLIALVGSEVSSGAVRTAENRVAAEVGAAKVGLVAVPAAAVGRASSFFAADLRRAMRDPLSGAPIAPPRVPALRNRDRLELIVHQVSSVLAHPGAAAGPASYLLRPEASYHAVKLPLECLRAVLSRGGEDGVSYAEVHQRRHEPEALSILQAYEVEALIRRRESWDGGAGSGPTTLSVVTRTLGVLLGTAPEPVAVLRRMLDLMADRTDLLSVYQLTCVALFLLPETPADFAEEVLTPALQAVWARASRDGLGKGAGALDDMAELPKDIVAGRSDALSALVRRVRLDYYRILGDHIFGMRPRTDYCELDW